LETFGKNVSIFIVVKLARQEAEYFNPEDGGS
jgi:hypothetical protein